MVSSRRRSPPPPASREKKTRGPRAKARHRAATPRAEVFHETACRDATPLREHLSELRKKDAGQHSKPAVRFREDDDAAARPVVSSSTAPVSDESTPQGSPAGDGRGRDEPARERARPEKKEPSLTASSSCDAPSSSCRRLSDETDDAKRRRTSSSGPRRLLGTFAAIGPEANWPGAKPRTRTVLQKLRVGKDWLLFGIKGE